MKRNPKFGDLIMIGNSTKPMFVVETGETVVDIYADAIRQVRTFTVIAEDKTGVINPRTTAYALGEGLGKKFKVAKLADLYLLESVKLKRVVDVTYERPGQAKKHKPQVYTSLVAPALL